MNILRAASRKVAAIPWRENKPKSDPRPILRLFRAVLNVVLIIGALWGVVLLVAFIVTIAAPGRIPDWFATSTTYDLSQTGFVGNAQLTCADSSARTELRYLGWVKLTSKNGVHLPLVMAGYFIWLGLVLVVVWQLRRILGTLAAGDPFVRDNARRIKTIGWSIIIAVTLKALSQFGAVFLLKQIISINGRSILPPTYLLWKSLPLGMIFVGLAIAEVFRIGARIRAEQELTI